LIATSQFDFKQYAGNVGLCILIVSFTTNILRAWPEFDLPLVNPAFALRQTQTALGIREFSKEKFSLTYEIPVSGEPWLMPFEFPLYQWVSAVVVKSTGLSVEVAGRIVSLLCHYLTACLLIRLLVLLNVNFQQACIVASVLLLLPIYQFWQRSVMIESMALMLGVGCTVCCISILVKRADSTGYEVCRALLAAMLGIACGLVKVTTFGLIFGFVIIQSCVVAWVNRKAFSTIIGPLTRVAAVLSISVFASVAWTKYADSIKREGELTIRATSASLMQWNFGTFEQRLSVDFWQRCYEYGFLEAFPLWAVFRIGPNSWVPVLTLLFIASLAIVTLWSIYHKPKNLWLATPWFIASISGPLIFANLYYVHRYYWLANLWLLAVGWLLLLWDRDLISDACSSIWQCYATKQRSFQFYQGLCYLSYNCLLFCALLFAWPWHYYPDWQHWDRLPLIDREFHTSLRQLATNLPSDDDKKSVIIVLGLDVNPEPAYFLSRKTLCIRENASLQEFVDEGSRLKRSGYKFVGLLQAFPATTNDLSIVESLKLRPQFTVIDNRALRYTALAEQ
jgi:hypothetical protein